MKVKITGIFILIASIFLAGCGPKKRDYLFYNGDIVTMNGNDDTAEALWVKDGIIQAVGSYDKLKAMTSEATELIDLQEGALLPGFVEPHMHMVGVLISKFFSNYDVTPCLPEPYETRGTGCFLFIKNAVSGLNLMPKSGWYFGNGLDPSRMAWDENTPAIVFHDDPAVMIDESYPDAEADSKKPALLLDQSGHLAYVNIEAFVAIGVCPSVDDCNPKKVKIPDFQSGGEWVTNKDGTRFTGLIQEMEAIGPFVNALVPGKGVAGGHEIIGSGQFIKEWNELKEAIDSVAQTGVTTVIDGGAMSQGQVELVKVLALLHPVMRYRQMIAVDLANNEKYHDKILNTKFDPWPEKNNGLYSLGGIKLWADGSTQGCTASLNKAYSDKGVCAGSGKGHKNYADADAIVDQLFPYWKRGWYMNIHANGDLAIEDALSALQIMQKKFTNDYVHTLIHATVGKSGTKKGVVITKVAKVRKGNRKYPPVNVHTSHLIAHVAYWGGALQILLDGKHNVANGRAAYLDATLTEKKHRIPFSLHSDAPVSITNPLWFVEQAVTRNTWYYPNLKNKDVQSMPGNQKITVIDALRAVTIEPARQHQLDHWIGSLEKGKVADLVILDQNPLKVDQNEIHQIRVRDTFLGGKRHSWPE